MKAAVLKNHNNIVLEEIPIRKLNSNEILVKVVNCGICGTDRHIYEGNAPSVLPIVLGHEFSGIVADNNHNKGISIGDKVAIDPNIYCGNCTFCREGKPHFCKKLNAIGVNINGGFAEYSIVPLTQIYKLPPNMDSEISAFAEPVSCCLRGIEQSRITVGETVIIIGGGSIGQIMLQLVKLAGASKNILIEPLKFKRDLALNYGATDCFDPNDQKIVQQINDITNNRIDVIIECVGSVSAVNLSLKLASKGTRIVIFGLSPKNSYVNINLQELFLKEISLHFSYLNPFKFYKALEILSINRIQVRELITKKFDLSEINTVFPNSFNSNFIKYQIINSNKEAA